VGWSSGGSKIFSNFDVCIHDGEAKGKSLGGIASMLCDNM